MCPYQGHTIHHPSVPHHCINTQTHTLSESVVNKYVIGHIWACLDTEPGFDCGFSRYQQKVRGAWKLLPDDWKFKDKRFLTVSLTDYFFIANSFVKSKQSFKLQQKQLQQQNILSLSTTSFCHDDPIVEQLTKLQQWSWKKVNQVNVLVT